jgi:hypothetical protein
MCALEARAGLPNKSTGKIFPGTTVTWHDEQAWCLAVTILHYVYL